MIKSKIAAFAPFVIGEVCLLVFLQKFLYGYAIASFPTELLFGAIAYNHIIATMLVLIPVSVGYVFVSARTSGKVESKRGVAIAGGISFVSLAYILFDMRFLLPREAGEVLLWVFTLLVCGCFCIIFFAWSTELEKIAGITGTKNALIMLLCACFIYCMITPSDGNWSPYTIAIELLSLPLAALLYFAFAAEPQNSELRRNGVVEGSQVYLFLAALLFLVVLAITYIDHLNANFPLENYEQPTLYAALLLAIAAIAVGLHFGDQGGRGIGGTVLAVAWVVLVLYFIMYLIIFWLSSSSVGFDFHLTCTLRRFVVMTFYVALAYIAISCRVRLASALVFCFLLPFLGARIAMRMLYYGIALGVIADSLELRLALLLALGIAFVLLVSMGLFAVFVRRQRECENEQPAGGSVERQRAVDMLAERYQLSGREKEILYYLSLGYNVSRIAGTLYIAASTVATHSRSVYKKMDLHNKQDVIDAVDAAMSD